MTKDEMEQVARRTLEEADLPEGSARLTLFALPATRVQAQRGALIEELFRTVTQAQLEREQRKRLEREEELRQKPANTPGRIQPIPVPAQRPSS